MPAKGKEEKKEFDGRIWPNLLDFNVNIDTQLTSKANFLFGASTLLLIFILNKLVSDIKFSRTTTIILGVLLIGSFISSFISLMIVLPKLRIIKRKERIRDDVFYYKNIKKFYGRDEYYNYLKDLPFDNERIAKAYSNQVYSLATVIIPRKFRLLKISGWVLIGSVIVSILIYLLTIKFAII
jgi:hypothetical protein